MVSTNQTSKGAGGDGLLALRIRLDASLDTVAAIMSLHGDAYTPIFERLEREQSVLDARSDTFERAMARLAA